MNLEGVLRVLDGLGASYALIGAHAMAARGYPRFTVDVDLLTSEPRVLDATTWVDLVGTGATVHPRRGDVDDPLGGVVHIQLVDGSDIDLILAKWKWEAGVIERAQPLTVAPGVTLPVPATSDLILLKLAAGGFMDLQDAAALLEVGGRETMVREVEARIAEVRPDVGALWRHLLSGSTSDEGGA
jgi:hypothetical protein